MKNAWCWYKRNAFCASYWLSNFLSFFDKQHITFLCNDACCRRACKPRPHDDVVLLSHAFSHFSGVNRTCLYVTTPTINRTAVKPINHDIPKRTFGANPVP